MKQLISSIKNGLMLIGGYFILAVLMSFIKVIPLNGQEIGTGFGWHTIVVNSEGKVYTWGYNNHGQLGNGKTDTPSNVPVAVDTGGVLDGKTITAVAMGMEHSIALASDGTIYTWGRNDYGQLGNGNNSDSNVPVAVVTSGVLSGKTIISVAAGVWHSIALASDGTVYTWGRNAYGELGNGNAGTDNNVPVAVNTSGVLSDKIIISIAGGEYNSIALASDGTVYAWGHNDYGQLGNGNNSDRNVPFAVDISGVLSGKTITAIASGRQHSIALRSDGIVYTWGTNSYGQLGDGNGNTGEDIYSNVPVAVNTSGILSGKTITDIAAGWHHSIALSSDGVAYTWGINVEGELGNGNNTNSNVPVAVDNSGVLSGKTIIAIAAGMSHSIALSSDGMVYTWGWNYAGQLGNGNFGTDINVPVELYQIGITSIENDNGKLPLVYLLSQNYPNPFNPSTTINYQLPVNSYVTLKIYNILGKEVATLINEYKQAGNYGVEFSGKGLSSGMSAKGGYASGVYFYKLEAGNFVQVKKMILLK